MIRRGLYVAVASGLALLTGLLLMRRTQPPSTSPAEVEPMAPTPLAAPEPPPPRRGFARVSLGILLVAGIVAIAAVVALTSGHAGDKTTLQAVESIPSAATATLDVKAGASAQAIRTTPTPVPQGKDVARLIVPSLDINAPIVTLGVEPDGTMQAPSTPTDVGWYTFSALPGERSNIVMAGHVDYINYGPAVFYHLKDAKPGEDIELVLVDGSIARYQVQKVTSYDEATAPVQEIVGPTDTEMVTLITCGGVFDTTSREYNQRVVLRATRIANTAQSN